MNPDTELRSGSTCRACWRRHKLFTSTEAPPQERGVETILVAEDEPALREKVREVLEAAGYRVLVSKDVDDAIQIVTQHKVRLICC